MNRSIKTRRQQGFTLLEILIALAVLGLLVIGLNQGIRSSLSIWATQTRQIDGNVRLDSASRTLRNLLAGIPMVPVLPAAASNPNRAPVAISFSGSADRLTFVGDMPSGLGDTRRADITLALVGGRVTLRWTPHRHEQSNTPPAPQETELLEGVDRFELAYWGMRDVASPAAWLSEWPGPKLPQLIRVRLTLKQNDRHWPDIVVAPQLSTPEL